MTTEGKRTPEIVGWEITRWCNLTCTHCFTAASRRPHDELTTSECKPIIDTLAELGTMMIGWTGGEPLLRNDLEELAEYAWSKGIRSNVTTNGLLLDRNRAERLISAGCHTIQISLDGSSADANGRIRGTNTEQFEQVLSAIRTAKSLGVKVVMASLVGRDNLEDARRMIEVGKREHVDAIRFCGFTPTGRGKRKDVKDRLLLADTTSELLDFVLFARNEAEIDIEFDVGFGPLPFDFGFHKCVAGIETLYLKANGDVYPCTALAHRQFLVGNIRTTPLKVLWGADDMTVLSRFPLDRIDSACRACDNFFGCHGACRGATLAHTGEITAAFPQCLYKAQLKNLGVSRGESISPSAQAAS